MITRYALKEGASIPKRGRNEDVGYDLTVLSVERASKEHGGTNTFMIDFGVSVEPPSDHYFELIPRSSLAWTGFIMPNSVGVIDPNYRGSLKMPLVYMGSKEQADKEARALVGRRIAQLVLRPYLSCEFVEVSELSKTERASSGFGSSGL